MHACDVKICMSQLILSVLLSCIVYFYNTLHDSNYATGRLLTLCLVAVILMEIPDRKIKPY